MKRGGKVFALKWHGRLTKYTALSIRCARIFGASLNGIPVKTSRRKQRTATIGLY